MESFFSVWDFLFQILILQSPRYSQLNKYKIMIFLIWINMYILLLKYFWSEIKETWVHSFILSLNTFNKDLQFLDTWLFRHRLLFWKHRLCQDP